MRAALLSFVVLALALASPAQAGTRIAVTIDDVPWVGKLGPGDTREAATQRLLAALGARDVPATGFVVCDRIRRGAPFLRAWLDAGLTLGSHSGSHPHIDALPLEAWEEDVRACKKKLERVTGRPAEWFRYPYLQRGRTVERRDAARAVLKRLGHRVAPVTIDTSEWALVQPYVDALRAGDRGRAGEVGAAWVEHVVAAVRHYRDVAQRRVGRDVDHVLLLHANVLAADHLPALLDALVADGAAFVPLEEALRDEVYRREEGYAGPIGLSWLYRMAPQDEGAWAWDDGQLSAMRRRFGAAPDDEPLRFDRDLSVRPLAPRVWVVTHQEPWPANSLVALMADGRLLLVDTPYTPEATERLVVWLRARFGPRPIVAVNTHAHDDAAGGDPALLAARATVHASDATARALAAAGQATDGLHTFPLADGLTLRFGAERVVVHYPGPSHAPDVVAVHLPDHDVLFGGCALKTGDDIGNTADADMVGWPAAIEALRAFPAKFVVAGHGSRTDPGLIDHTLAVLATAGAGPRPAPDAGEGPAVQR